mmetsp:Transcript_4024/g.8385  ORF Transcript_4024/g.8385 Transcript_4024/m.8385 type:complete len:207 (+) Transcript_4024:227-847(+)
MGRRWIRSEHRKRASTSNVCSSTVGTPATTGGKRGSPDSVRAARLSQSTVWGGYLSARLTDRLCSMWRAASLSKSSSDSAISVMLRNCLATSASAKSPEVSPSSASSSAPSASSPPCSPLERPTDPTCGGGGRPSEPSVTSSRLWLSSIDPFLSPTLLAAPTIKSSCSRHPIRRIRFRLDERMATRATAWAPPTPIRFSERSSSSS